MVSPKCIRRANPVSAPTTCVDLQTGKQLWSNPDMGAISVSHTYTMLKTPTNTEYGHQYWSDPLLAGGLFGAFPGNWYGFDAFTGRIDFQRDQRSRRHSHDGTIRRISVTILRKLRPNHYDSIRSSSFRPCTSVLARMELIQTLGQHILRSFNSANPAAANIQRSRPKLVRLQRFVANPYQRTFDR